MDLTLVLHSRDIANIGFGDSVDPITSANPNNILPPHLQTSTITLRIEVFANKCPLAAENLGFVANRHLMGDADAEVAISKARSVLAGASTAAAPTAASTMALSLRETTIHRLDKNESLEFGTSGTESVFGGTYASENLDFGSTGATFATSSSTCADGATPATHAGFLVVSNFGGPSTNGCRYFITLKPMKVIIGNHTILGRVRSAHPSFLGGIGNGFERLLALLRHPQFKINARTFVPNNKMSVADSVVLAAPVVQSIHADPNNANDLGTAANGRKSRLAGKLRGRDDEEEAAMLREDFEKGLDTAGGNANPFASPSAFGMSDADMANFGAVDSRVRTTKKRRAESSLLSTAPLGLVEQDRLRSVAVSTAQHFEGHDDDGEDGDHGMFDSHLRRKVFTASVTQEELAAAYRPVGVNPNQMAPSTFNVFEANAMTFTSDLQEVLEQQLERQQNRERRMGRKQKALERQQQTRLGGLGGSGAETSATAALKAALAATSAAAQVNHGPSSKVNKARSSASNINDKLGRIREKFSANGQQHSVKAFQERAKAKAAGSSSGTRKRY